MRLQIGLRLVGSRRNVTMTTCLSPHMIPSEEPPAKKQKRLREQPQDSSDPAAG